jgi:signal transduction histidine kinase
MLHSIPINWRRCLRGTRSRILIWYFLLTSFSTVVSILATRQIFYERIQEQSKAYVARQVKEFRQLANIRFSRSGQTSIKQSAESEIKAFFDTFLSDYKPLDSDDYAIALVQGRPYRYTHLFPQALLTQDPVLIQQWGRFTKSQRGRVNTSVGGLYYRAEPIRVNGQTQGVLVIVHCADSIYQLVDGAILLIIPATLGVLTLAAAIAWATTGRILSPLRSLTETAQSITESDMSQRIAVEGTDEIAKLTLTFNEMLDRLQFAFAGQQEFLKDAGHELRTPITVIRGYLETLKYRPDRQEQTILFAIDELDRMGRLINDLLLLAKTEHPDFLTLKPEELDWLTEELYLKVSALAARHWKLESKGLTPVRIDRQRITQAVLNLVQNAIRHTQPGDTIAIGSSVRDHQVHLWVRDTGEGILPADQQRIFERFTRATTRHHAFEGYGLGLSIVQAIVQAHGGWVTVSSRRGEGATFTIVLPLATEDRANHAADFDHRRQSSHQRLPGVWVASPRLHDHRR